MGMAVCSVQFEWLERQSHKSCAGCLCSRMFHTRRGGWLGGVEPGMPASNAEPAANARTCTFVSYPAKALSRVSSLCFALQFSGSHTGSRGSGRVSGPIFGRPIKPFPSQGSAEPRLPLFLRLSRLPPPAFLNWRRAAQSKIYFRNSDFQEVHKQQAQQEWCQQTIFKKRAP